MELSGQSQCPSASDGATPELIPTKNSQSSSGGILENGTETQTQEQYSTNEQHKRRDYFGTKRAGATWLHSFSEQESWIQLVRG
jgi:hypothetical protein